MIIGIDIGTSITKAVSIDGGKMITRVKTKADDAVTSAAGAFGKILLENDIKIEDISKIRITGAGATKIKAPIFGIPTEKVDEITAIGIGGIFLSRCDHIVITNIGTGTVIIAADRDQISHLGGSGVGGGTILGLAKRLLSISDFNGIMELAHRGSLTKVDLLMEDIMDMGLSFLGREDTASNFGKMLETAGSEDIALGIVNMVYQVIGMLSVFAAKSRQVDRVIITGNGSNNAIGKRIFQEITRMYAIQFEYPPDAEYTTAIGAGLSA